MLGVKTYEKSYVADCESFVAAKVSAYANAVTKADPKALAVFEPSFFNGLVLELEVAFVHRLRGVEGKNGNPMNEVRLLAVSMLTNGGELVADTQIKLKPETSVLGLAVGDKIALTQAEFERLASAYFAAIRATFT